MADDQVILRSVSWRDLCPWIIILRIFRLSISLQLLTLATLGILVAPIGWWACGQLLLDFTEDGTVLSANASKDFYFAAEELARCPCNRGKNPLPSNPNFPKNAEDVLESVKSGPVFGIWRRLISPFCCFLSAESLDFREGIYLLVGGLWTILVWAFFGAAITRSAALQLAVEDRPTLTQVLRFVVGKFGSYVAAPLLPILIIVIATLVLMVTTGLLARWDSSLWISGLLWGPGLLLALVMVVVLLGLCFGWPLMWSTISFEGTDAFDALSRSFSYTFQRPLHYLFYTVFAAVIGTLGWYFVFHFSESIIDLSYWAASWSAGEERIDQIQSIVSEPQTELDSLLIGAKIIGCWEGMARTVATAFTYSFFWTAFTAIYLLLRQEVDQAELDEVYLTPQDETYGLPPLETDEAGVQGVADLVQKDKNPDREDA